MALVQIPHTLNDCYELGEMLHICEEIVPIPPHLRRIRNIYLLIYVSGVEP